MKQFENLTENGLIPYIATGQGFLKSLDLSDFEENGLIVTMENKADASFHEAYLLSNSLAFGNPNLKMPNWVYIDCVLMQGAVAGFAIKVEDAPDKLLQFYKDDENVDLDSLEYLPISGQIAGLNIDGNSMTGFSLFSLRKYLPSRDIPSLALLTKYLALKAYKADQKAKYIGISQYDNRALITHGAFCDKMYIDTPMVMMHPCKEMSFTYSMKIDFDIFEVEKPQEQPDFYLKADDTDKKKEMSLRMQSGERFYIAHPIQVKKEDGLYLPICIEKDGD